MQRVATLEDSKWEHANASTGEPITENSVPDLDDWGWDTYWDCVDWIEWHKIMKEKKGKEYADKKFLEWWNKQTDGAHAISCRSVLSTAFRDYTKKEKLYDSLFDGIGVIAKPIGTAQDVVNNTLDTVSAGSDAIKNVVNTLKIIVPIALIGTLIIGGLYAYNKYGKG